MPRPRAAAKPKSSSNLIGERLVNAIAEQRIAPGTRLVEDELGQAFGVSRTVVRQALTQLAAQGLVAVRPRQGWFVVEPSETEVRQAFAARRLVEAALIREFTRVATRSQARELHRHLIEEHEAIEHGDPGKRTGLLGDFHVQLAAKLGNPLLVRVIADLVTRTNLMSMLYQSQQEATHSAEEHEDILRAIEAGNADQAVRLMELHLRNVEAGLKHRKSSDPVARLQQVLAVNADGAGRSEPGAAAHPQASRSRRQKHEVRKTRNRLT